MSQCPLYPDAVQDDDADARGGSSGALAENMSLPLLRFSPHALMRVLLCIHGTWHLHGDGALDGYPLAHAVWDASVLSERTRLKHVALPDGTHVSLHVPAP